MDGGFGHFRSAETRAKAIAAPRKADGMRWRGKLKIPQNCHPLVRQMFRLMNEERAQIEEIAEESGNSRGAIWSWGKTRMPGIDKLDAALNVMGYALAIVPIKTGDDVSIDDLPADLNRLQKSIARTLRRVYPSYLSPEEITDHVGCAPSSIKTVLSQMRGKGIAIERGGEFGSSKYRLAPAGAVLTKD